MPLMARPPVFTVDMLLELTGTPGTRVFGFVTLNFHPGKTLPA